MDAGTKNQDPLEDYKLILHNPYHTDLCNETECGGNEKVPNNHEGSASWNVREMKPVLSPDKENRRPTPYTTGKENDLLRSPDTRPLDNKNVRVDKACVVTGIIVNPIVTGKKPAAVISSIESFISRLRNKNKNQSCIMDIGDIRYGLGT